jgi:glycosyltransferase involved in cell wall biosynthesis
MNAIITHRNVEAALAQRLRAVSSLLILEDHAPPLDEDPSRDAGNLLDVLVNAVREDPSPARMWLLCTAVSGSLPRADDVVTGARFFQLAPAIEAMLWVLDYALQTGTSTRVAHMELRVVRGGVLVDVDHTARHDLHTGIQQVVRQVLPLWARDHDIVPVVWTDPTQAMRSLTLGEYGRAFLWEQDRGEEGPDSNQTVLIVPWQSVVLLAEVPSPAACDRLTALAQFSANEVVAIGYDCIPVLSPDLMPVGETNRFARYLPVIKHVRRVATIGATATSEFRGFASALSVQGLSGPVVSEVPLPVVISANERSEMGDGDGQPLILCVGTFEPRKNQMALLYAAERLWREGLSFELLLIGGSGWGEIVPRTVARLQQDGRSVRTMTKATSDRLQDAYNRARFTVFASLHEGFGLPVAESLEYGTPVITTNFGSTGEIGKQGGAILVDPYDDEQLVAAMRSLLVDDELLQQLHRDIRARSARTWDDYATEVWETIVVPEVEECRSGERRRS